MISPQTKITGLETLMLIFMLVSKLRRNKVIFKK